MFDIWASVAELHQPCLYRPITDRLLTTDRLIRKEVLASIDHLLCEQLARRRASFQAPPAPARLNVGERYINTSAMQKAIRRGDADLAMACAQRGCMDDPDYTFRRLATCAVKDVGLGNLLAVGMALAVMGNKQMRTRGATDGLAAYLAYLLAISPKSRLACDLLSIADYDPALRHRRPSLHKAPVEELRRVAMDQHGSWAERMLGAWFLAGTTRLRGSRMPRVARHYSEMLQLIARARAPLLFYYLADRTAGRLSDAMCVSWMFIAEMIKDDPTILVRYRLADAPNYIGQFPTYAFDLHTGEGRTALNRFSRLCSAVADALTGLLPKDRDTAIRHAVFLVEGGRLSQQLRFDPANGIEAEAHRAELSCAGLNGHSQQDVLMLAVIQHLPQLDALRREEASAKGA